MWDLVCFRCGCANVHIGLAQFLTLNSAGGRGSELKAEKNDGEWHRRDSKNNR